MSDETSKLIEAVNQAVIDKTLSLDGLNALQMLKSNLASLQQENILLRKQRDDFCSAQLKLSDELKSANTLAGDLGKKVAALEAKQAEVDRCLIEARYAELRRSDAFELVRTIFRSPVTKRTVSESESQPVVKEYAGQNAGSYVEQHSSSKTVREETTLE